MEIEQDVVITGLGLITAGACSPQLLFERLCTGDSCVTVKGDLKSLGFPNPAGVYIDEETWAWLMSDLPLEFQYECWDEPIIRLTVNAADQAFAQSRLDKARRRAGIFTASNRIPLEITALAEMSGFLDKNNSLDLDQLGELTQCLGAGAFHGLCDMSALVLARRYGFQDMVMTAGDACAASGIAIGTAYRYIHHGELDVAIAGGTELLCNFIPFLCFNIMGMASSQPAADPATICRPFDSERKGFVLGEGSAFLVLESANHAQARGVQPLARISGFSKQAEAGKVITSAEDGSEFARCMQAALDDAGLSPDDIDHINAHGTSTHANDACESLAIAQVFGKRAATIPVTSNKSAIGHSIGASSAIEAILSVLSLSTGILLPTLNYHKPDPDLPPLDIVIEPRRHPVRTIMSSSFGMGGENCSLILQAA